MTAFRGIYYDGKTSRGVRVLIQVGETGLISVEGESVSCAWPLSEVRIGPRIANSTRSLYFPDQSKCETENNTAVDSVLAQFGKQRGQRLVHRLESKFGFVLLALIFLILIGWAGVEYGIPSIARQTAFALPASVNASLGSEGLNALDGSLFSESKLDQADRTRITELFAEMTRELKEGSGYRLVFRHSSAFGANALALPSGIVVLTDDLVALAGEDSEIVSILAHEIGHITHRHALRRLLQDSVTVLIIMTVSGDISGASSLAATLPAVLVDTKYSREFETEADSYAVSYLKKHNVSTKHFANILVKLEKASARKSDRISHYFSTHPATEDRIKKLGIE